MATGDKLVTLDDLKAAYDNVHIPSKQLQITTGQWSGSGPYTITASATNVTANSIVDWQMDSSINYLASDLTVTTGAGTVTLSTATKPTNTINITLFFPGTTDDVDVQVLSDVYSKSQTDALVAQSTASLILSGDVANGETKTLLPVTGGSHILILSRKNNNLFLVVAYDQWSEGYSVVAGAEKSGVTITKGAASAQITIVNTVGYAFGYKLI